MKKINSLTTDELKKVFNNNLVLQKEVYDDAIDTANIYVNDYLNCFECGTLEYNIGYPGDYMIVKNKYDFIQGLKEVYKMFCILPDETLAMINYCDKLMERYDNIPFYDCKNTDRLEKRINELVTELKNIFFERILDEYNFYYNGDNLQEYFLDSWIEATNDNYYVDDNYTLYQHIEYEKSYK